MTVRAVAWRVVGAAVLFAVLYAVLALTHFEPRALPLLLLVVVGVAVLGLVADGLDTEGPGWTVDTVRWTAPPGQDHRTSMYLRTIEGHLTAAAPDGGLRDKLAALAALRLEQRHRVVGPGPRRDALLGPEVTAVLDGPVHRLSRAEITRCLQRIEEL